MSVGVLFQGSKDVVNGVAGVDVLFQGGEDVMNGVVGVGHRGVVSGR